MTQDGQPGQERRRSPRRAGEIHPQQPVFQISVVAQMVGVHQQTLRSYERIGLVSPARSSGNTRLYSFADVERVRQVLRLVEELGVNLAGADVILRMGAQIEEMRAALEQQARDIDAARREIERLRGGGAG
ncbi:MAG: MerR family transcriptional regulator [Chloroflexi bacterium]|nr:MerR family transcriptional regulator [Chloroflexota bacterium]